MRRSRWFVLGAALAVSAAALGVGTVGLPSIARFYQVGINGAPGSAHSGQFEVTAAASHNGLTVDGAPSLMTALFENTNSSGYGVAIDAGYSAGLYALDVTTISSPQVQHALEVDGNGSVYINPNVTGGSSVAFNVGNGLFKVDASGAIASTATTVPWPVQTTGTGTITMTAGAGSCTSTVNLTASYAVTGKQVTLRIPRFTCTANGAGVVVLQFSGLPAAAQPVNAAQSAAVVQTAAGVDALGSVNVNGSLVQVQQATGAAFTNAAVIGLGPSWGGGDFVMTYCAAAGC